MFILFLFDFQDWFLQEAFHLQLSVKSINQKKKKKKKE